MSINTQDNIDSPLLADDLPLNFIGRIRKSLGPALPGITLDLIDAMSLTRNVGPFASFPLGLAIGIWLSTYYRFSWGWKFLIAIGSGLYTLTPGTELIPLATILTCLGRFVETSPTRSDSSNPTQDSGDNRDRNGIPSPMAVESSPAIASASAVSRGNRMGAKCPECESQSLKYGQVGQRFWPTGCSAWSNGHEINAFVCLECGFVGHFLSASDLESLEQKQA